MNKPNSTNAIVEAGILTAIEVGIILFSFYIPLFYFIGMFLAPIPIAMIYIRHNIKYSILLIVAAATLSALLTEPISALGFIAIYGILGIILGYCIINKESASFTILIMAVSVFISTLLAINIYSLIIGQDAIAKMLQMVTETAGSMKQYYLKAGISKETVDTILNVSLIKMVIPATLAVYGVVISFFSYLMAQNVLKRFRYAMEELKPFSEWYIPAKLAIGIVLLILAGYLASALNLISRNQFLINAGLIFQLVFSVDGMAVVSFYLKKRAVPGIIIVFLNMFLFLTPINILLPYIGLMDYVFNIRKLDVKRIRKRK